MTYSQLVKEELLLQDINHKTAKIELIAAFKALGVLEKSQTGYVLNISTTQIKLIKRIFSILKNLYPKIDIETSVRKNRSFNHYNKMYTLKIKYGVRKILHDLNLIDNQDSEFILFLNPTEINKFLEEEKRVYVRMFFCCLGSVNDPKNAQQYHLEIVGSNEVYLNEIKLIVKKYDINFKVTKRKNNLALYLNKSEEIADFLKFIYSKEMLLYFEDFRMIRDLKLVNNRLNNADIANETKKIGASQKYIDAINYFIENGMLETFGEKTLQVVELRMENPDESLQELSDLTKGKISKSNIRYHLNLLFNKYNQIDK